jgi:hypothetical protein
VKPLNEIARIGSMADTSELFASIVDNDFEIHAGADAQWHSLRSIVSGMALATGSLRLTFTGKMASIGSYTGD